MKSNISFQERAKLAMEIIAKQSPMTLEMARLQIQRIKERSISKNIKGNEK